jgi:RNA polymerase sigma-70 factor (ECF subfamily)
MRDILYDRDHAEGDDLAALLAACATGDRDALRRLYELEAAFLLGVALRIVRRRAAAEDVLHDAFVRIWTRAGSFDPARGDARAWMATIVRRRAVDFARDEEHRGEALFGDPDGDAGRGGAGPPPGGGDAPDPREALARLRPDGALAACLAQLSAGMQASLLLAYLEGLSHRRIAARLDVPTGTARAWVRRGLLALRACLP